MSVILQHAQEPVPRLPDYLAKYQPAIDKMMAKRPGASLPVGRRITRMAPRDGLAVLERQRL